MIEKNLEGRDGRDDTERPKGPEKTFEYLSPLLEKVAKEIAEEVKKKYGIDKILNDDCTISMEAYKELAPKIFADDMVFVNERERMGWYQESCNKRI